MAHPMYGSGPLRSRNAASSDEIQLRIDPVHGDLDEEIDGLHSRVRMLKGVAQEINSEAKFQNDFLNQLLTDPVLASKIKNHAPLKPQPSNTYIVHANHLASLEHWYHSMVATDSPRAVADESSRILYTYDTVMHGFAVQLTGDEARSMSDAVGVSGVYEDRMLHHMTTRTPGFLGLDPDFGVWRETDFGDGVIIGFVDSDIWPESPSFNDKGLGPVRSSWRGKCIDAGDFNASLCNNKLVGAKAFDAAGKAAAAIKGNGPLFPRDTLGHGTHVASTAAGSEVGDTGFHMFARGTARGVAPKAKIAMYKVSEDFQSMSSDVAAAIDAAVKDGVDIKPSPSGMMCRTRSTTTPSPSPLAPWMTTVGAATVDRLFPANLTLGNGVVLAGQSLYTMQAKGTSKIELVSTDCNEAENGKIMVCMDGAIGVPLNLLQNAGGAGIVDVDPGEWSRDGTAPLPFPLPGFTLSYTSGEKLRAYMASEPEPVASFSFGCETVTGKNRAPVGAGFSSRGPNPIVPELLKPGAGSEHYCCLVRRGPSVGRCQH
ncbi:Subtilisin-like protease SBT1.4 [Dichanthelium oligosanthes]|uniref:Subtilisin-like protease SBT1.4 n=1 Tax=Dichanthelium oligosanthes TaxID=888268 RepID=A0A1E5VC60_9POAL|nr:Subtilisin-like protease SBT1.4 [Dichanthelium oligosanthes]